MVSIPQQHLGFKMQSCELPKIGDEMRKRRTETCSSAFQMTIASTGGSRVPHHQISDLTNLRDQVARTSEALFGNYH